MKHTSNLAVALAALLAANPVLAADYTEVGDAGESLATAAQVNTQAFGTSLDAIIGTISGNNADLFAIQITDPVNFTAANPLNAPGNVNTFDSQLFLFDANGFGVLYNQDAPGAGPTSFLSPSAAGVTLTAGLYYLAIAPVGYSPLSAGGLIFPNTSLSNPTEVVGPTGPGGSQVLSSWTGNTSSPGGDYRISLTGAAFVPEPSTGLLSGLVLLGGLSALSRRAKRT
jgi:hypothetical protein